MHLTGNLNIYEQATSQNCFSIGFSSVRKLYTGLKNEDEKNNSCIVIYNNNNLTDTYRIVDMFAWRLYDLQRSIDINCNSMRTPIILLADDNTLLAIKNAYTQFTGNEPAIALNKNILNGNEIKQIDTKATYVADKLQIQKEKILAEFLSYLGINNIPNEKRERLTQNESDVHNEFINYNLRSFLQPRLKALEHINKLFDLEIELKLNSDLDNIIKNTQSIVKNFREEVLKDE